MSFDMLKDYLFYQDDWATIYCGDCLEIMPLMEPESVDLVLTDPPYGLGMRTVSGGTLRNTQTKFMDEMNKNQWDNAIPSQKCFDEIFRISKNQIIFGYNYFYLPPSRGIVVWDKMTFIPTMSRVEIIWTSLDFPAELIVFNSNQHDREHPTQKPFELVKKLIQKVIGEGMILDPFLGSGTTCVAAKNLNRKSIGIEINPKYCEIAVKRLRQEVFDFRKEI